MTGRKTSEAELKATRAWEKRNPDLTRQRSARRQGRYFVRHFATVEDMKELIEIFNEENSNAKNNQLSLKKD